VAVYTRPDPALASLGPGMRVAGYQLEESVGQGGMAVVFRAQDERLKRVVALKLLAPGLIKDKTAQERFLNEAYAAAAVDHPHIIPVHDAGNSDGLLYIATKFVPGGDLRAVLAREPGLPRPARVATLLSPVASALDAAHQVGLVHRDVKPANILVDSSPGRPDHVYLADFGVSKWTVAPANMAGIDLTSVNLTGTGFFLGTPEYSAPEQVLGKPVGPRTDQYALAVVAFTLLTGERMFRGDQLAVMYAQVSDPPPAATSFQPQLPAAVDDVLWRALAKDPRDRFGSCGEFADALRAALGLTAYGFLASDYPDTQRIAAPGTSPRRPEPVPAMDPLPPGPRGTRPMPPEGRATTPRQDPYQGPGTYPGRGPYSEPGPYSETGTYPGAGPYPDQPRPLPQAAPPARGRRRRSRAVPVAVSALLVAAVAAGSVLALAHWHVFSSTPSASAGSGGTGSGGASSGASNAANNSTSTAAVTDLAPAGVAAGADYLTASQGPGNSLVLSHAPAGATSWSTQNVAGNGTTFSAPSVAVSGTTVRIAAQGPGHSLTLYRSELGSSSWSPSTVAGSGTTFSAPSIAVGDGQVVITAEGPNGSVLLYSTAIGAQNWHKDTVAPAGTAASPPSVVVDDALGGTPGSGTAVAVGVHGQDHGVQLYWLQVGTSTWNTETITAPHTTLGASSLTLDGTTLAMATEGTDHSLKMNYTPSPTTAWRSAGVVADPGTTYSAPSMAANGKHVVDVAAQGPDGSLLFYWAQRGTSTWHKEVVAKAHSTLAVPSVAANGSSSTITAIGPGDVVSSYFSVNGAGTWQPVRVTPRA
jgi:serine/threonine protein kinase